MGTYTKVKETVLLAGGAGYIGSHIAVQLIDDGYDIVVVDSLVNSHADESGFPYSMKAVERLTGVKIPFYNYDIRDKSMMNKVFEQHQIKSVIHLANHRSVAISLTDPLEYYDNNLSTTIALLKLMQVHNVGHLIYSGSATVYGDKEPTKLPLVETMPTGNDILNPYSQSKHVAELIIKDCAPLMKIKCVILRYFNPVGAHPSGEIGENPKGRPICLLPIVSNVAVGKMEKLCIFGDKHPTPDGTCVRDYTHVMDIARAHSLSVDYSMTRMTEFSTVINIGSGVGTSILQLIASYEKGSGVKIPYEVTEKRKGDVSAVICDNSKAGELLNWKTKYSVQDMCEHVHKWVTTYPEGYP